MSEITPAMVAHRIQTFRTYKPDRCQWCFVNPPTRIYVGLVSVTASCQDCFDSHVTLIWERYFCQLT